MAHRRKIKKKHLRRLAAFLLILIIGILLFNRGKEIGTEVAGKISLSTASEADSKVAESTVESKTEDAASASQNSRSAASTAQTVTPPAANANESALVYNLTDNLFVYGQKIHIKRAPASLTKLLAALTALKYASPDTVCTVGRELEFVNPLSTLAVIQQGERLTLEQLLYGMLLASGNDAAYTVADQIGRIISPTVETNRQAVDAFVAAMNETCAELGMNESHFTSPDGWDNAEQKTTAYNLLLLTRAALQNTLIAKIVKTVNQETVYLTGQSNLWHNGNKLINPYEKYYMEDCIGVKTGGTNMAGQCLISAFSMSKDYVVIVLNCETEDRRYRYTAELVEAFCE